MKRFLFLLGAITFFIGFSAGHGGVEDDHSSDLPPGTEKVDYSRGEVCPDGKAEWREFMNVEGVEISKSERCNPDNPYTVATAVKGSNNVDMDTLMKSGLARDAVVKGEDRDGDGDPDVINITLEITGINEENQTNIDHEIAPGIEPSFWAFAPKTHGMVESGSTASELIRMPSPTIRIEEGDRVNLKVENTHYMPHTVHLHGVDHPFNSSNSSSGNDGVPAISEEPIKPGDSRTYQMEPRQAGEMMYHCHVVPAVHVEMGLAGMFVVEEEEENNTVQTLNVGAGKVRHVSENVEEDGYEAEYDMIYQAIDKAVHQIPKEYSDTRKISEEIHREWDATDAEPDYFLLNGKSFPYTLRESIINVEKNEKYKLNALNVGPESISLHPHGHKMTKVATDGVELEESEQRDVFTLSTAQRATFSLNTTEDGLNSYGSGSWLMHDHTEPAVTTDGISPGGNIGMIAYQEYINDRGLPETAGNLSKFFSGRYYEGRVPYFQELDPEMFGAYPDGEGTVSVNTSQEDATSSMAGMAMSGTAMDMEMRPGGMVINGKPEELPPGCSSVSSNSSVYVEAGNRYAEPGNAFEYSVEEYDFDTCERVTVEVRNLDEVRHQWMLHGLPEQVYPMGMFNIEVDGGETVKGTFITPSEETELNLHCSVPQHEQKGMQGAVRIGEEPELSSEEKPFWNLMMGILG
jgi:FtsP/CotA-like multicopper oxidase with cupredoxin domain